MKSKFNIWLKEAKEITTEQVEAKGIEEKAEAMKLLDGVGKEHEEFKLRLNKNKEVELVCRLHKCVDQWELNKHIFFDIKTYLFR